MSTQQKNRIHPHKFILWVAIASIIMMFAGLTSAYIVKSNQANWEVVETPDLFWYSTIVILLSSLSVQLSLRSFKQREMAKYRVFVVATAVLGVVFVILQYLGFKWMWSQGVKLEGSGAGQFLYIIAGLHALHVIGGIIALFTMVIKGFVGKQLNYNPVPIELAATYWHFVDVLWIYLLIFFIWLG